MKQLHVNPIIFGKLVALAFSKGVVTTTQKGQVKRLFVKDANASAESDNVLDYWLAISNKLSDDGQVVVSQNLELFSREEAPPQAWALYAHAA